MADTRPDATEPPPCATHDYYVLCAAPNDRALLTVCDTCGQWGLIPDPTADEWERAFDAPYRWDQPARVAVRGRRPDQTVAAVVAASMAARN
jgi:hypothetical protein